MMTILLAAALAAQLETGRIERHGAEATLVVSGARPLDMAAIALAREYRIPIHAEDPLYDRPDDLRRIPPGNWPVPGGGSLEVRFPVDGEGRPSDVAAALRKIVDAYNAAFRFRYRVVRSGEDFFFAPEPSVLDHRISLPKAQRTFQQTFDAIGSALTQAARIPVSCGTGVASNYLLQNSLTVEARQEPARDVILRAVRQLPQKPQLLTRYDPVLRSFTINVAPAAAWAGPSGGIRRFGPDR